MKKSLIILLALLLTGCGTAAPTFETIGNLPVQGEQAQMQQLVMDLPNDAAEGEKTDTSTFYQCEGYTISVQTMAGGDLGKTIRNLTGFERENVKLIETESGGLKRCHCLWTSAGEQQLQVGRACILDDGNYHYAVAVMAGEQEAGKLRETWSQLFSSIKLIDGDVNLSTGS